MRPAGSLPPHAEDPWGDGFLLPDPPPPAPARPTPGSFRRGTASAAMAAGMVVLHEVIHGERDRPAIVAEDPGGEPPPRPVRVELDPDDPAASRAMVRPDLLPRSG